MKPLPLLAQKVVSGLIAAWFAAVVFGFVIGLFTLFLGSVPGAVIGYIVGFRWGYNRVQAATADTDSPLPTTSGDTAFLALGCFGFLWLAIALPDLLFGFSGPYKGNFLGSALPVLGLIISPFVALLAQAQARRHIASPLRDLIGVVLVIVFLWTVSYWWKWAVARDADYSQRHPFGFLQRRGVITL